MWGNHLLDIYQHTNFNVSFPHDLTRNPTRLIQWQYWWWFWFSSVFVLYYFLISKVILKRSLKFKPKIVTSYRSHGRWGDIVVAVIPIFWCLNILSHSTLLLRMSEFQTETNILTIRVRGRQWYWVYKMEIANFLSLSNKKILLNGEKTITASSNFRGGFLNVFEKHEALRQYWRAWFQNKYIFFYNNNLIKGELVTSDTNLNDLDTVKKNKEWSLKITRAKASWYNRSIDSNMKSIIINKHFLKPNKNYFFIKKELYFGFKKITKNNYNILNFKRYNERINVFFKNNNNINFNNINYKQSNLNIFFVLNKHLNYIFKNTNNFLFNNSNVQINNNNLLFFNKTFFNYFSENFFNKTFLEIFKSNKAVYLPKNINFNYFLQTTGWSSIKEPVKYSYELKTKFGYLTAKMELISPVELNLKLLDKINIIALQQELEYEHKNLETTFKYFLVFDQHRKPLNRFFKITKDEFTLRQNKIISQETITKKFKFNKTMLAFNPIKVYDSEGRDKTPQGVSPFYRTLLIKTNLNFIKQPKEINFNKIENLDFFSPSKYNVKNDYSILQGNIKNNKKLIFNQRLLHTTSILVLPTSLNITVITNSYDVIHSWFIPGLGLKMDCVPGRSTHHTLFIDHPGLYYGQCAEICGRFHHHMPIKIAALQWEHFLLWWYHYTMNLGLHPLMKDFNKASLKELKTKKIYPITTKFNSQRPII